MIRCGNLDGAQANRRRLRLDNGTGYWKSDLIIGVEGESFSPQAFLIEQDPDTVIRPHFHRENQFQVVVAGDGRLGKHPLAPVSVHYAGRYTGYGPVVAGPRGVTYLTLRDYMTPLAWWMPESRDRMERVPRRHLFGRPVDLPRSPVAAGGATVVEALIEPQSDGIAAWCVNTPPSTAVTAPAAEGSGDRYYVVLAGSIAFGAASLSRFGVAFARGASAGFAAVAGDAGALLLALQFPLAQR